ncbi:MAG: KH domain-containing protein [Bacteroidota bacterium]|nr:KH domain-containing protein [Bacteroidota bacterium]MDP2208128.1 KH domain-containing protein [Bacteroidota bacterium]
MKEFIEFIAKNLVDKPEEVSITEELRESKTVFKLKVGESDIGKVIGKQGKTAQAMRTLLSAVSAKEGKRVILEIVD